MELDWRIYLGNSLHLLILDGFVFSKYFIDGFARYQFQFHIRDKSASFYLVSDLEFLVGEKKNGGCYKGIDFVFFSIVSLDSQMLSCVSW